MNCNQSSASIVRAIRRCFARFPHVESTLSHLKRLHEYSCDGEEPEHIMLIGESGVGKSTVLQHFAGLHPRIEHEEYTEVPVLYAKVPASCTIRKLAQCMLKAMNSPFWDKGDEGILTNHLVALLKNCKVRQVILDEVNHLVERGGEKTHHHIADWIKMLSDDTNVSFVLSGIPRSERLLQTNDQLRGRFREVISIERFSFRNDRSKKLVRRALLAFETLLGDLPCVSFSEEATAQSIVYATDGRLREIRRLLVRAVELSFAKTSPELTKKELSSAFTSVIFRDALDVRNPFSTAFNGVPLTKAGEPFAPVER